MCIYIENKIDIILNTTLHGVDDRCINHKTFLFLFTYNALLVQNFLSVIHTSHSI